MQALFKKLLAEPALQNVDGGSISNLAHARYLVLKNLAGSLAAEDSTCEEALHLYVEASELDSSDAVLWHRLGSLVSGSTCTPFNVLPLMSHFTDNTSHAGRCEANKYWVCRLVSLATGHLQGMLWSQA